MNYRYLIVICAVGVIKGELQPNGCEVGWYPLHSYCYSIVTSPTPVTQSHAHNLCKAGAGEAWVGGRRYDHVDKTNEQIWWGWRDGSDQGYQLGRFHWATPRLRIFEMGRQWDPPSFNVSREQRLESDVYHDKSAYFFPQNDVRLQFNNTNVLMTTGAAWSEMQCAALCLRYTECVYFTVTCNTGDICTHVTCSLKGRQ